MVLRLSERVSCHQTDENWSLSSQSVSQHGRGETKCNITKADRLQITKRCHEKSTQSQAWLLCTICPTWNRMGCSASQQEEITLEII